MALANQPRTLTSAEEMRLLAGLVVQPFLSAGLAFLIFPLVDRTGRAIYGGVPADATDAAVALALGVGIVAFFVTLLGALPTAIWLVKRHRLSLKRTLWCGLALANIPVVLGTALTGGGYGPLGTVRAVVFASFFGVICSAVFWLISIRGRGLGRASPAF